MYFYIAVKNNLLIKQKKESIPQTYQRIPEIYIGVSKLNYSLNSISYYFRNIVSGEKFIRQKENKSDHLHKLQPNAWPNLKCADHVWHIIVESKYIHTYCI